MEKADRPPNGKLRELGFSVATKVSQFFPLSANICSGLGAVFLRPSLRRAQMDTNFPEKGRVASVTAWEILLHQTDSPDASVRETHPSRLHPYRRRSPAARPFLIVLTHSHNGSFHVCASNWRLAGRGTAGGDHREGTRVNAGGCRAARPAHRRQPRQIIGQLPRYRPARLARRRRWITFS